MISEIESMSPRISGEELKKELSAFARELGFDSCRVAACASPPHAGEFRNWLREGAAGEMSYMERAEDKRCDPQKVLPGARSVIVVALNYFQGAEADVPPANSRIGAAHGRVARYAWGDDYHDVIAAKLDKIDGSFANSAAGKNTMWTRAQSWSAIMRLKPASGGMVRARC